MWDDWTQTGAMVPPPMGKRGYQSGSRNPIVGVGGKGEADGPDQTVDDLRKDTPEDMGDVESRARGG